jgi:alanyl-tRNA synthetase
MDNPDVFMGDLFELSRKKLEEISGKKYGESERETRIFRIIMDHLRGATFLIGDGVIPSNKERGYFVRRLVRRAIRFAHKLGVKENFTEKIAESVIDTYADYYTNLVEKKELILDELQKEEEGFRKTLEKGLKELFKIINVKEISETFTSSFNSNNKINFENINGGKLFDLFQTYGFPFELSLEEINFQLQAHSGISIDDKIKNIWLNDFNEKLKEHQKLSRTASAGMFKGGLADTQEETMQLHTVAHLMLAGLRKTLGDHVHQKGSNINGKRVRFDFSHPEKMTDEQKQAVEEHVNEAIEAKIPVEMNEMPLNEARESGAEGAFENKYGDVVKVFSIQGYSSEICGGPHVKNTGDINGKFRIKKEQSSSAGVRRIKAILE